MTYNGELWVLLIMQGHCGGDTHGHMHIYVATYSKLNTYNTDDLILLDEQLKAIESWSSGLQVLTDQEGQN